MSDEAIRESTATPQARERLLKAWRGEIIAGRSYELIANRLPDREADILRRMAAAEGSHRQRLEQRMRELVDRDPVARNCAAVLWMRLQARVAPIDRLLAAREAAEDEEVDDLYKRSTGDPVTDTLLHDIRKEERSHSLAVSDIRSGNGASAPTEPPLSPTQERAKAPPRQDRRPRGVAPDRRRLGQRRDLRRQRRPRVGVRDRRRRLRRNRRFQLRPHGRGSGRDRGLAVDGDRRLPRRALRSAEIAAANVERERREIAEHPEEEKEELSLFYQLKGIDEETADAMAEQLAKQPDAMLRALAAEEFGGMGDSGNAKGAAIAAGISTGLGAMIPVLPFIFTQGTVAIVIAAVISLIAHFLVGAAKSLITLRTWWAAGLEMTVAGVIVGGATYLVGLALPT